MAAVTVLIVDDNEKNMRLARDVLRASGLETLEAANGAEGIAVACGRQPDVILMDIRLPDMDGTEAMSAAQGRSENRRDPDRCADLARDEGRSRVAALAGLRRLPREADRRARVPGAGAGVRRLEAG